jgi:hypothetical protein
MTEELLERRDSPRAQNAPEVPSAPPEGLDTVLYENDARSARSDLRRQVAVLELELGRLVTRSFPRKGVKFGVPGAPEGPHILSVDELERVRDGLVARIQEVRGRLHEHALLERRHRKLLREMIADPAAHRWARVDNPDMGQPGCTSWRSRPRYGLLGMLFGWWQVKVSSGCPLAKGPRPPDC